MRFTRLTGGLALAAALHASRAAGAQDTTTTTTPRPATRDSAAAAITLPGVSVTATRSAAAILATPLAITKITAADLRAVQGFGIDEALSRVPGVVAQSRYGTSDVRLMIRGYGSRGAGDRSNSGTTRGVRILLDGIPETEPDGRTALDQLDLATAEAVEVIRSNASAAWGNASGGVVNVSTVPTSGTPTLEARTIVGGFGLQRYVARAAAPLGAAAGGGRIYGNFTNSSFDGWREHSGARRSLVNAGAVGTVGDRTRLGLFLTAANTLTRIPGPLTQAQVDADPRQANAIYRQRDERRYNRSGRLGATVDHQPNPTSSLSAMAYVNPKYLQRSERNTYRDFTRYHVGGNVVGRATLLTGRTVSRLTAGVDGAYQDGAILFYTLSPTGGRGNTLTENKGEGASNVGVFLQDELSVTNRLSLLLGARYDQVAYNYRSFLPNPPVRADRKAFSRVSPRLGVNWLLGASHALYANVGGGIEVPAGNETDPTPGAPPALLNPLLDPIRSTTYEVGFKSMDAPPGRRGLALGYDVALYDIEVENEVVPYSGGRYYLTAGKARRRGAELGLNARTRGGLFTNWAVTLADNHYLEYVVDSAVLFPADPAKAGKIADYGGNEIVGLPGLVANVEGGIDLARARGLRLKAGVEHAGDYYADDANRVPVPSYTIVNLTAELRQPLVRLGGVDVRGFVSVRNVTGRRYIGSAFLNPDLMDGAPAAYEPGTPRTVVVSLSLGWLP